MLLTALQIGGGVLGAAGAWGDSPETKSENARRIADWNNRLTKHYQNITDWRLRGVKKSLSEDKLTQDLAIGRSNIIAQKEALKKNTFRGLESNAIKMLTSAPENIGGRSRTAGRSKTQQLLRQRHQTAYNYTRFIKEKEPFLQETLRRVAEDKQAGIKGLQGPVPHLGSPPKLARDSSFDKFTRAVVAGVKGYGAVKQGLGAGGAFEGLGKWLSGSGGEQIFDGATNSTDAFDWQGATARALQPSIYDQRYRP